MDRVEAGPNGVERSVGAGPEAAQTVALTERQAARLLERYLVWQGAQAAAQAALATAEQARARYADEVAAVADLDAGATAHVDFAARTLTIRASSAGVEGSPARFEGSQTSPVAR